MKIHLRLLFTYENYREFMSIVGNLNFAGEINNIIQKSVIKGGANVFSIQRDIRQRISFIVAIDYI